MENETSKTDKTLLEAETPLIKNFVQSDVIGWHFLPELPPDDSEVLIAYKYDKKPILGYWNKFTWKGSRDTREWMKDGYCEDARLTDQESIVAWMELPNCPDACR
jgi:hypothetical protein